MGLMDFLSTVVTPASVLPNTKIAITNRSRITRFACHKINTLNCIHKDDRSLMQCVEANACQRGTTMMTILNNVALRVRWAIFALAAHFIGPLPPPEMSFILPATESRTDVESWATVALTPGPKVDVAKTSFVTSATHYKSRNNKLHEKLLIVVHTPHGPAGTTTYLVTDRGPERDLETRNIWADSSANVSLTSKDVWANDRICVPGTTDSHSLESYKKFLKKNQYYPLCTVTISLPMSVAQLAVLLRAVYRHSVHYNLKKYQCYWYAYTVWEILRREYGGQVSQNELEDKRGKYMGVKIMHEDSVEAITEAYEKDWKEFCDEENRTRQQWEDLIRQAEDRGRAEGIAQERMRYEAELRAWDGVGSSSIT